MKNLTRNLVLLALSLAGSVQAYQQGTTAEGHHYLSGGVSEEEREELQSKRDRFSLWVITAGRKTGEYLSSVRLTITDARRQVVFDAPLDGPWLFIDLPLGRYVIDARYDGQTQQRPTTIHANDHHQAIFYFDADVSR